MKYTKIIPELGEYDVIVIGGGPSGVCAAIEAARMGSKVLLTESTGMLGGMATSGLVGPFMTNYDREGEHPVVAGIYREIIERLEKKNGAILPENCDSPSIYTSFIGPYHKHVTPIDPFILQIVLDELTAEAGVDVMLYTSFIDCVTENGEIKTAVFSALEGLRSAEAKIFIDCTGNASVAECAGVPTWKGDEESGVPQPGTLMFEIDGVDDEGYTARPKYPVKAYKMPQKGRYKVNHYHVYNVDAASSASMTKAHMEARKQVLEAFDVLKNETPGFENASITQVAPVLGIRESRHIKGIYTLTASDLANGVKFDDTVAAYGFGMDVHGRSDKEKGNFKIKTNTVYYVPYRSLVPLNCSNLLVAGKTISCESQAAGAIRVMPCAMAMGQAAGLSAHLCVRDGISPEKVNTDELRKILISHGTAEI